MFNIVKKCRIRTISMKKILLLLVLLVSSCAYCQKQEGPNKLYPILFNYARDLYEEYGNIPFERKVILEEIANYCIGAHQIENRARVLLIETNHASRAVLAQTWAAAAAYYYGIDYVNVYSGGIISSEIATNAVIALEKAGFIVYKISEGKNPNYEIKFTYNVKPVIIKSIKYNDPVNPESNFGSIILCSNADINLPVVKGNNFRTSLHYLDPAAYDGTSEALDMYLEKSKDIAVEMFYLFYVLKNSK